MDVSRAWTTVNWTLVTLCFMLVITFTQAENLEYQIIEELPVDTSFANIITGANLARHYGSAQLSNLRFSFLSGAGSDPKKDLFGIGEQTGLLYVKEVIDREEICPFLDVCDITLDVAVGPAEYFRQITVNIEVMDKNDNAPKFSQSAIHLYIPEISPVGSAYPIPAATDQDIGTYGVQSYRLLPSVQYFEIQTATAIDGSPEVTLVVQQLLDREAIREFQFELLASDGGNPPKSASMLINITIGDDNDNVPVFTKEEYAVAIQENTEVPTVIVQVEANDPDSGAGGIVSYAFSAKTFQLYGHMFAINENNGEVTLTRELDYESVNEYQLTISAKDGGDNAKASYAKITVRVLDVNDFEPVITINTLTDTANAKVSEDSPVGTFVAHVSVIDRDSGRNGEVSCSLLDSQMFTLEVLQTTQYKIVTRAELDREEQSQYEVVIKCRDNGRDPLETTQRLTILVSDFNDNAPVFTRDYYTATLDENNPKDAYITQVNATDLDLGANGKIQYQIMEQTSMFSIDSVTGVIRAKEILDFERFHEVEFSVLAVDQGIPAQTATAQVRVQLQDINDEAPKFTLNVYTFVVMENMDAGSHVGQITATDADAAPFNMIEYDFHVSDISLSDVFRIDHDSGSIYTRMKLDRESLSSYSFRVIAVNKGYNHMSGTSSVHVYVDDQNDNMPRISFPNATDFTVQVLGNSGVGEIVTQVRAMDADVGTSGRLSFTLSPPDSPFDIDTNTGIIILTKDIQDLAHTTYNLTVQVADHGTPPLYRSAFLRIVINGTAPYQFNFNTDEDLVSGPNMIIVIAVVAVSGILMVLLLCAIAWVVYRNRKSTTGSQQPQNIYHYEVEAQDQESVKQTTDPDLSSSTISAGFEDSMKRGDQRHSQRDTNRKNPGHRGLSDSGFSDVFTNGAPGKHVTFALATQPTEARQETASTSSNEGSNTDSGCILPDDKQQQHHHHHQQQQQQQQQHPQQQQYQQKHHPQHQHHQQFQQQKQPQRQSPPSPPPLLPPRLRESPPPLLPPRDSSPGPGPQFFAPAGLQPRHLTVRDVKAKDKLKRNGPQASDFAYNIPDVIQNNFSDSNSLLRYKGLGGVGNGVPGVGARKDRLSQSDNTSISTTSGSYVIDPREVTEYNV